MSGWQGGGNGSGGGGGGGVTIAPYNYGDVKIAYDYNQNPIRYSFYLAGALVGFIIVVYDTNGNAIDYQGYDKNGLPL